MGKGRHHGPHVKQCEVCGRKIDYRRKWKRDWENVKYCSEKCRRTPLKAIDHELERALLTLLQSRPRGASLGLDDAVRLLRLHDKFDFGNQINHRVRNAARRLAARHQVAMIQKGHPTDPSSARGNVKLTLV